VLTIHSATSETSAFKPKDEAIGPTLRFDLPADAGLGLLGTFGLLFLSGNLRPSRCGPETSLAAFCPPGGTRR
jgi:hypothetical protein